MRFRRLLFYSGIVILLLGVSPLRSLMQGGDCPDLVKQAMESLGDSCSDLDRNTACYGYNRVSAVFSQDVADTFFNKPSDRSDLSIMQSIDTAPLDTVLNQWGVAVLNVQANIPDTLPGQGARFILLGDVAVQNDVQVDATAATPAPPISVTTTAGANVRSRPTTLANVLESVPSGTALQADAVNGDSTWLRVTLADNTIGWVSRDILEANDSIGTLTAVADEKPSPMEAFHIQTGIGRPTCDDAPSALVVQGPQNLQINITADGANIQIGSTIVLVTDGSHLKVITLHGHAVVDGVVLPAGYTIQAPLDGNNNVTGNFGGFRLLTQSELDSFKSLEQIPVKVLNYAIKLPNIQIIEQQTQNGGATQAVANGKVDCGPFKPTSPLDGLAFGMNTFYWDAAPGATSYRVTVPGVGTVDSTAPTTNANLDLSSAGFNPQMSWYVEAFYNGQVVCTSSTVTIARSAPPPVVSKPSFSASWSCLNPGLIEVSYPNVPSGTTSVTLNYSGVPRSPPSGSLISVPPFQTTINGTPGPLAGGSVVAHPSGRTASLPSINC